MCEPTLRAPSRLAGEARPSAVRAERALQLSTSERPTIQPPSERGEFGLVPVWMMEHPEFRKLPSSAKWLATVLASFGWRGGICDVPMAAIIARSGESPKTVKRSLASLQAAGFLGRDRRGRVGGGSGSSLKLAWWTFPAEPGRGGQNDPVSPPTPERRGGQNDPVEGGSMGSKRPRRGGVEGVKMTLSSEEELGKKKIQQREQPDPESSSSSNGQVRGDKAPDPDPKADELIAKAMGMFPDEDPGKVGQIIRGHLRKYDPEWINDALDLTQEKRAKLSYVRGILVNSERDGTPPILSRHRARPRKRVWVEPAPPAATPAPAPPSEPELSRAEQIAEYEEVLKTFTPDNPAWRYAERALHKLQAGAAG